MIYRKYLFGSIARTGYRYLNRAISSTPTFGKQRSEKANDDVKKTSDGKLREDKRKITEIIVGIIGGGTIPIYAAILLKQCSIIKCIHLIDAKDSMAGAAMDISHIDTSPRVKYFKKKSVKEALKEVNVVALMDEADMEMSRVDHRNQLKVVSPYICQTAEQMARFCPNALVAVFARPVTGTVPMVSEIYKLTGRWNPDKIIGSTAVECMRMEAMTAKLLDLNPAFLKVPVIGGADANTVVPLFSRCRPVNHFTSAEEIMLLNFLRTADKELADIACKGPTLSSGAAATKLILSLVEALAGFKDISTCGFVRSNVLPFCRYLTTELQLGPEGVKKNFGLPKISPSEISLIEQAIPLINDHVETALSIIHSDKTAKPRVRRI